MGWQNLKPDKERAVVRAGLPTQAQFEQTRFLTPRPVNVTRVINISLLQSSSQPLILCNLQNAQSAPPKKASWIHSNQFATTYCCTDFGPITSFFKSYFPVYKMGTIMGPPKALQVLREKAPNSFSH